MAGVKFLFAKEEQNTGDSNNQSACHPSQESPGEGPNAQYLAIESLGSLKGLGAKQWQGFVGVQAVDWFLTCLRLPHICRRSLMLLARSAVPDPCFSPRTETRNSTEFVADAGEESVKLRKTKNHRICRAESDLHRQV